MFESVDRGRNCPVYRAASNLRAVASILIITLRMKRPAVFFDRDNTLIVSDGYLGDPSQVRLVKGAADAVARARAMGFVTVVFSNQSGVARGMFGEEDVRAVNARLDELLRATHADAL